MTSLDRRTFAKRMAMASAAAAAASLMPGVVFGDDVDRYVGNPADLVWKKTPCRFCGVGCGLLVGIQAGRAVAVRGDPGSPVNKGLACVKGYHSVQALYGRDRLTRAMVRRNGSLVEVSMREALDLVARKLKETIDTHGKDSVAMYGSGQWTIPAGYVASKLFKGALGTNNLEANARLCMSSAVSGFLSSFGLDEPMGCYDDIDHADVFVLWGNNMAEMHPVLFSRLLEQRQQRPNVRIVDLATRTTRTSYAADRSLLFTPQSDLAIANAICHEIVAKNRVNRDFVAKHVAFKRGKTDIGYGLSDDFRFAEEVRDATWDDYIRFLADYTPERAAEISGVPAADIRWLASLYGDPSRKVMSLWCMGMNQHTRGTWINNLVYNIHLLVGKIASPGNSPFSLTGQPSACGTVREVGTATPHAAARRGDQRRGSQARGRDLGRAGGEYLADPDPPRRRDVPRPRPGRHPVHVDSGDQSHGHHAEPEPVSSGRQQGGAISGGVGYLPDTHDRRGRRHPALGDVDRAGGALRELRAAHATLRADAAAAGRGHERHVAAHRGGAAPRVPGPLPPGPSHLRRKALGRVHPLPRHATPPDGPAVGAQSTARRHVALCGWPGDEVAIQYRRRSGRRLSTGRVRLLRQPGPPRVDLAQAVRAPP